MKVNKIIIEAEPNYDKKLSSFRFILQKPKEPSWRLPEEH